MKALLVLVMAVALAGCGGGKLTASGTLGLTAVNAATDDCSSGTGGYDDIHEGTSVVVYDSTGKKVAIGSLGAGKAYGSDGLCVFRFSVPDVPSGDGPYGVEVGSRGQVSFNESEASKIVISLG